VTVQLATRSCIPISDLLIVTDEHVRQFDWIPSVWSYFGVDQYLDRQTIDHYHLCLYIERDDKWWFGSSRFRYPSACFHEFQQWLRDSYVRSDYVKEISGLNQESPQGQYRGIPSALVAELGLGRDESSRLYPVETLREMIPSISSAEGDSLQNQDEIFRRVDEFIHLGSCYPLAERPCEYLKIHSKSNTLSEIDTITI
jgi:hypothetical protein